MTPSESERPAGEPAAALDRDGYTVLRGAISPGTVARLRDVAEADLRRLSAGLPADDPPFGFNPSLGSPSHGGFMCPLARPYLDVEVVGNPRLHAVTEAHLGEGYYLLESVLNSARPNGGSSQQLHGDAVPPGEGGPPSAGVAWVIPLGDVGPAEGMTELVPGSQDGRSGGPAIQPALRAGDVLVRDLALHHRGMPNRSPAWRLLFTLVVLPSALPFADDAVRAPVAVEDWALLPPVARWLLRRQRIADRSAVAAEWPSLTPDTPDADGGAPGVLPHDPSPRAEPPPTDQPAVVDETGRVRGAAGELGGGTGGAGSTAGAVLVLDGGPPRREGGADRAYWLAVAELERRPVVFVHPGGGSADLPLRGAPGFVELRLEADGRFRPVGPSAAGGLPAQLTAEAVVELLRPRYCRAHRPLVDLLPLLDAARAIPLVYDRPEPAFPGREVERGWSDAAYRERAAAVTVSDRALAPHGAPTVRHVPHGWPGPGAVDAAQERTEGKGPRILVFGTSAASESAGVDLQLLADVVRAHPELDFALVSAGDSRSVVELSELAGRRNVEVAAAIGSPGRTGAAAAFLPLAPRAAPHPAWSALVLELIGAAIPVVTTAGGDVLDYPLVRAVDDDRAAGKVLEALAADRPLAAELAEARLVAAASTWAHRVRDFEHVVAGLGRVL